MYKLNIALVLALFWIASKFLLFQLDYPSQEKTGMFINLFFILLVTLGSLYQRVSKERVLRDYGSNFKHCLKSAGLYTVLVTAYVFAHYKYVNPSYLNDKKEERIAFALSTLPAEGEQMPANLQGKTRGEVEEEMRGTFSIFASPSFNTSLYFLGLFVISIFYSILSPILYKKVFLRM